MALYAHGLVLAASRLALVRLYRYNLLALLSLGHPFITSFSVGCQDRLSYANTGYWVPQGG